MSIYSSKLSDRHVPIRTKDQIIDSFELRMHETYLQFLDPAIPLHLMADGGVRSAVCKMRLMAHHPSQYKGKSMPRSERDMLFATSVQMVEYDVLGKSTRALDAFGWHLDVAFQIDALVFMLIASRTQIADAPLTQKAWHLVSDMYKYRPALMEDSKNELYAAVRALTLRAWVAREADMARNHLEPLPVPNVISELREREARRARTASMASICIPPEASALHQLAGVATQVDTRCHDSGARFMFNNHNNYNDDDDMVGTGLPTAATSFRPDVDLQLDGMLGNFMADIDVSGWAPVDWDYWNALLKRNNVLQ